MIYRIDPKYDELIEILKEASDCRRPMCSGYGIDFSDIDLEYLYQEFILPRKERDVLIQGIKNIGDELEQFLEAASRGEYLDLTQK